MFLLNVVCLSNFQKIIGQIYLILQGFNLLSRDVSVFLKIIEKRFSKKIQKHEKQKSLVSGASKLNSR